GGVAVAAISTRSTPLGRARFNAATSDMTPLCLPSMPMTRTSRARIFPLTLTNEAEEAKLRGGKRRLKQTPPVETYSCRWITDHINLYTPVLKPLMSFAQVNNKHLMAANYGEFTPYFYLTNGG